MTIDYLDHGLRFQWYLCFQLPKIPAKTTVMGLGLIFHVQALDADFILGLWACRLAVQTRSLTALGPKSWTRHQVLSSFLFTQRGRVHQPHSLSTRSHNYDIFRFSTSIDKTGYLPLLASRPNFCRARSWRNLWEVEAMTSSNFSPIVCVVGFHHAR